MVASATRLSAKARCKAPRRNICGVYACPDQAAINGFNRTTVFVHALERVSRRNGQQTTYGVVSQFTQQFVEVFLRQVRSRGIMDQHPVVICRALGMQVQQRIEY
ncbi:MAG: hypothetical protein ACFWUJ_05995 [Pseudomonas fragi]